MNNTNITVLMPVYNCKGYVKEAIESILNQTYTNFELIIIDDCSTDGTLEVIKTFIDPRIRLIVKPANSGYTDSLNFGLSLARGEYIARMDSDDISEPKRFELQKRFLDEHPDYVICGSFIKIIGENTIRKVPSEHSDIKLNLIFANQFAHPSVMFRKETFVQHSLLYNKEFEPSEDYDLWTRLILIGKGYNFKIPLLNYRVHYKQISQTKAELQIRNTNKIRANYIEKLFGFHSPDSNPLDIKDNNQGIIELMNQLFIKIEYWKSLESINRKKEIFDQKSFSTSIQVINDRLLFQFLLSKKKYSIWKRLSIIKNCFKIMSLLGFVFSSKIMARFIIP